MADFYSRKHLFVACIVGGSFTSACTGWSITFGSLFLAQRVHVGQCACRVFTPWRFFLTEECNAASSGLTAMMGHGIIAGGKVYASTVAIKRMGASLFCIESAEFDFGRLCDTVGSRTRSRLQRKSLARHVASGQQVRSTHDVLRIHSCQGLMISPIAFCCGKFLNDYLSQEKGFSVPDATFMVMLFGIGCAIGGICGGSDPTTL
jgi:translation initiation factor 4G